MKIIKGNIFNTTKDVLVNTVNAEGYMGKGMALECKLRFPGMFEDYKVKCMNKEFVPGHLDLYKNSKPMILNFATTGLWRLPSKEEYLVRGLSKFNDLATSNDIKSIAFPLLGSSLGGLDKERVIDIMLKHLEEPSKLIDIVIYDFDPRAEDKLFKVFFEKVKDFREDDFKVISNRKKTREKLMEILGEKNINSMMQLQKVDGITENTLKSIHDFIRRNKPLQQNLNL